MLIYKNTFDNIKSINCDFLVEDQFYATDDEAIVADGITRDPIGISDLSGLTQQDFLENYPKPSGGFLAAKEICNTFSNTVGTLKDRLIKCNNNLKKLNAKYILKCDYLENDYYGAVASCITIKNNILDYAYICDCGIIVYDSLGNIKFQTEDDKKLHSDPFINQLGISWNLPEARIIVRRDYRNNLSNIHNGKCISYGALTGEDSAISFIRNGQIQLVSGDIVLVYSDGFNNFLHDKDFISQIINFQKDNFESYIKIKSQSDYENYGKEKTIVLFKIKECVKNSV